MAANPASFTGTVTTTGRSSALLLEKPFFRAHPEFRQKAKVTAHVIAPGYVLVGVDELGPDMSDQGADPVAAAYLAFLEQDMVRNPSTLTPVPAGSADALDSLLDGVVVADSEELPEDVTF